MAHPIPSFKEIPPMIRSDATFGGTFPFAPHFTGVPGFQMHYVDEGPRDGEVVLCLHGEPTWGYLFRHLIASLSQTHRVVAPDHMGFGKSETRPDRSYWLQDHIDNLERFVLALDLSTSLVMHDFGGPVGMGFAARHPDRIRRIISVNAPTPFGQPDLLERVTANATHSPWFQWIMKASADGSLEQVLGQLGFNILSTLKLNGSRTTRSSLIHGSPPTAHLSQLRLTASVRSAGRKDSQRAHTGSRSLILRLTALFERSLHWPSGARQIVRSGRSISCRSSAPFFPTPPSACRRCGPLLS
jgi:pimeloyl-ACP methyl ester carboxylesterase